MSKEEKILTLHPQGKNGVNIDLKKYTVIRDYILEQLSNQESMASEDIADNAHRDLSPTFDGKVIWYYITVKLDLEARGIIKRVPKTSPHHLKLVK